MYQRRQCRYGRALADVHIACMGIEKIIPQRKHLGVFLRLLARSATGQPITTYSVHFKKPRKGQEMHIVLVDNGRSRQLARDDFQQLIKVHPMWGMFEYLPGVSPERWPQLPHCHRRSDRFYLGSQPGYEKICRSAFCLNTLRLVFKCMPG